jgi:LmbE family N-acetylglucosaminyl deacetylase
MLGQWRIVSLLLGWAFGLPAACAAALSAMSAPQSNDRVLVIAPHPDDESLCCAGILQRALANGAAVAVVWLTAGDSFQLDALVAEHRLWARAATFRRLGAQRLREAQAAADALGVPRSNQYSLGYPDRGLTALLAQYYRQPYRSNNTGVSAVPYADALRPGASYTGENLERDLQSVLDRFHPTLVLAAAPQDLHPDHSASGALVRRLLERNGTAAGLRYWIVHARHWPRPRSYEPQLELLPPASAADLAWQSLPLTNAERERKRDALRAHRSQRELIWPFMNSFVRANEILAAPN